MRSWIEDRREWLASRSRSKHKPFEAHCARLDVGVLLPLPLTLPQGCIACLLICSSSSMKRSKFRHSCNRVVMINYLHPRLGMLPSTAAHSNALRLVHRPWDRLGEGLCTLCGWFVLQCARTRILFWLRRSLFHNDLFPIWMCSHFRRIPNSNGLRNLRRFSDRRVRWQVWRVLVLQKNCRRTRLASNMKRPPVPTWE